MKIKIVKEIIVDHTRYSSDWLAPPDWWKKLDAIKGKIIEVDTQFLFRDQFNTVPIPGVSDLGLRIMLKYVEEVIDDIRPKMVKCNWCGNCQHKNTTPCKRCGTHDTLKPIM